MSHSIRVAAVQMTGGADKNENVETAIGFIERAADQGVSLVVLPETWSFMGESADVPDISESVPGEITNRLAEVARRRRVFLHGGSIHERAAGEPRAFNTSVVINPDGDIIGSYRKIHLFDVSIGEQVLAQESTLR